MKERKLRKLFEMKVNWTGYSKSFVYKGMNLIIEHSLDFKDMIVKKRITQNKVNTWQQVNFDEVFI